MVSEGARWLLTKANQYKSIDMFEMRMNARWLLVLVPVLLLCACSRQRSLAHRLAGADRVIVTNTFDRLSLTVTGEEVDKLIRAIAGSKKESPFISATVGLRLEFFKGAQHLGTAVTSYGIFWVGHTPYIDRTETLKTLYERFREAHLPNFSR